MPRRPRPASWLSKAASSEAGPSKLKSKSSAKRPFVQPEDSSDSDSENESSVEDEDVVTPQITQDEDLDLDAPRVAQWVDEDELEGSSEGEDEDSSPKHVEDDAVPQENLDSLQIDMASLPLGALRMAQRALARAQPDSESEDESDESPDLDNIPEVEEKRADKPEWSAKPRTDISKRKNKHAPTEVTSKKPVTRRRQIIEVPKMEVRDPRFLPFTGQFKPEAFRKQYEFLSEMHTTEMKTLREHLRRAKKLLSSSPRDQREEREQEVVRLEQAVKRAESSVNKDKRDKIEHEALSNIEKEEREKRKDGKGAWFMKDSDKKKLLVRARYDALAADGGQGAVKKAIEKKQKKVGQKEKKRRPFAAAGGNTSRKRSFSAGRREGTDSRKRQRVE